MPKLLTRGSGLSVLMILITAAAMIWATSAAFHHRSASMAPAPMAAPVSRLTPDPGELRMALAGASLTPPYIAAVGANANAATAMVAAARDYLTEHPGAIAAATSDLADAQAEVDRLERLVQQGQATEADVSAMQTARATLEARRTTLQSELAAFRSAATAGFSQAQSTTLSTLRANAEWEVPMQYKAVNRTVDGWIDLRNALANDRISRRHSEEPDPQGQAIVTQANAEPATMSAGESLSLNLEAVEAAYEAAVRQ